MHDATELDYTTLESLANELGQIGRGTHRGYFCQNVIALDASTGEVLGLLDQILHCRRTIAAGDCIALGRGWMKLQYMLDGYLAVKRKTCGQT